VNGAPNMSAFSVQKRTLSAFQLKIVIVAVGTSDAFHALQTDVQVASRFEPLLIPRWTETDAFRAFVVAYGKLLPLRKSAPRFTVQQVIERLGPGRFRGTRWVELVMAEWRSSAARNKNRQLNRRHTLTQPAKRRDQKQTLLAANR
jgi:hypothetical protein